MVTGKVLSRYKDIIRFDIERVVAPREVRLTSSLHVSRSASESETKDRRMIELWEWPHVRYKARLKFYSLDPSL